MGREEYLQLCEEFAQFFATISRTRAVAVQDPTTNGAIINAYDAILSKCLEVMHTQFLPAYMNAVQDLHRASGSAKSISVRVEDTPLYTEFVFVSFSKRPNGEWLKTWTPVRGVITDAGILPAGTIEPAWAKGMREAINGDWL